MNETTERHPAFIENDRLRAENMRMKEALVEISQTSKASKFMKRHEMVELANTILEEL